MIRTEEVQRVCCDRCEDETSKNVAWPDLVQRAAAHAIFNAAHAALPAETLVRVDPDICARCISRILALAEQIRTQPRRGRTKAWQEGPEAEKVKT